MKFKYLFLFIIAVASFNTISAQKIKLKKGSVLIDGEKNFEYEKRVMATEFSLYDVGKENEILFIARNTNETPSYANDDFMTITFIKENKTLETTKFMGYSYKYLVGKLLKEKVLDMQGVIDVKKLDVLFSKYDENITNRTIRH